MHFNARVHSSRNLRRSFGLNNSVNQEPSLSFELVLTLSNLEIDSKDTFSSSNSAAKVFRLVARR